MGARKVFFNGLQYSAHQRLAHAHCRAGCGMTALRFFFQFFKKCFWKKNFKVKRGENIFFSNFFPKMFFEKLNFFQKYQSAQNVQVGGAPVNLQHMRPLFIGNSWSFPGGTHSKGTGPWSRVQFRKDISVTISLALRCYQLLLILPSIHIITL